MRPNSPGTADLVTFIGETLNEKLHFFVQCLGYITVTKKEN